MQPVVNVNVSPTRSMLGSGPTHPTSCPPGRKSPCLAPCAYTSRMLPNLFQTQPYMVSPGYPVMTQTQHCTSVCSDSGRTAPSSQSHTYRRDCPYSRRRV